MLIVLGVCGLDGWELIYHLLLWGVLCTDAGV